jgi:hypothetical protein
MAGVRIRILTATLAAKICISMLIFLQGSCLLAESEIKYYFLSGLSAAAGARGGRGASLGVLYKDCNQGFCSNYGQFVGHTFRQKGITYTDAVKSYSFLFFDGFAGLGIRTTNGNELVGQVTYGFGAGPAVLSIRRYTEDAKPLTELAFSVYYPLALN